MLLSSSCRVSLALSHALTSFHLALPLFLFPLGSTSRVSSSISTGTLVSSLVPIQILLSIFYLSLGSTLGSFLAVSAAQALTSAITTFSFASLIKEHRKVNKDKK